MPQALPYIAYVGVTALGAGAITTGVVVGGAALVSYQMTNRPSAQSNNDPGRQVNFRDSQTPVPIIYGQHKVGGNQVYISVSGNNEYLNIIQTISEGEIDGIVIGEGVGAPQIWLDDKLITVFGDNAYWEFKSGTPDQTPCFLGDPGNPGYDPTWSDPLHNTAYLYIRLKYDRDLFTSIPTITALVKGRKVMDPRTGANAWSDNPALCFFDLVVNERYGVGMDKSFWDAGNIADAATWCESKNYCLNCVIAAQEPGLDIAHRILDTFRATVFWSEEKFLVRTLDWESPVMSLTEDDIVADSFSFETPSLRSLPGAIRVKYHNAENGYIEEDLLVHDPPAIVADGETREHQISLLTTSQEQATKIAAYQLDRRRLNIPFSFVAGPKALALEPGDFIQVTHSLPGWYDQVVRVEKYQPMEDNTVALTVLLEDETLYDDVVNVVSHTAWASSLPDPLAVPPPVGAVTFDEEIYSLKDNTYTRLKISWSPPVNYQFLDHVEVWGISKPSDQPPPADEEYIGYGKAVGSFSLETSAKEGDVWYFKLVSVSTYGIKMPVADTSVWSHEVLGRSGVTPADVPGFMAAASGDAVHLRWQLPQSGEEQGRFANDLSGYEIRTGNAEWDKAVFLGFTKTQLWSLIGVKPGTHSFLIKAKDALGKYSANASATTVKVFTPPGYTIEKGVYENDFAGGIFSNMEAVDDPVEGRILRVIHSGGLSGDYTSPVYNFAAVEIARFWLDFQTVTTLSGVAWEDGLADTPWDGQITVGQTWDEFFGNVSAGRLTIKFFYSQDGVVYEEMDNFQILSCEVQAMYFKYQIFISDLNNNSYIWVKALTAANDSALRAYYWQ